jgi:hypothetical protein
MKTVCFHYLYRDAGNNKQFAQAVFSNRENLSSEELEQRIRGLLKDGENFIAKEVGLPECFFEDRNDDDHTWHEFEYVIDAGEGDERRQLRDITDLLTVMSKMNEDKWVGAEQRSLETWAQ